MRWSFIGIIEHLDLFNKIFNGQNAIKRKVSTIAIILAHNYYHVNAILKNYEIENMTLENNFRIIKHFFLYKIKDLQFIILPRFSSRLKVFIN